MKRILLSSFFLLFISCGVQNTPVNIGPISDTIEINEKQDELYIKANKWRNEVNHGGLLFKEASSMTKSVMDEIDRVFQSPFLDDLLKKLIHQHVI